MMRDALLLTVLLLAATPSAGAGAVGAGEQDPEVGLSDRVSGRALVQNPDGTWTHLRVRNVGGRLRLSARDSANNGLTWGDYRDVLTLPDNEFGGLISAGLDRDGELQVFLVRKRDFDQPGAPGVDRFLDLYQTRSSAGRTRWDHAPQLIAEGYLGQLMAPTTLADGRIIAPFQNTIKGRTPPTGSSISTAAYSDDGGATWTVSSSRLTAPVAADFNGSPDGAVEPIVIDQSRFGDPALNRQKMLIRTQDGFLYESFSTDRGQTWSVAARSIFPSSNSAAAYAWLPDRDGDGDEELIVFWNNTRIIPRYEGQGVYSGRDAIHAAISGDGGVTWDGFREVHLDPSRHETPPSSGDRGTANPFALLMNSDDRVALLAGNGPGAATIYVDPDYLFETTRSSDFTEGFAGWSAFTHVGPATRFFRDRVIGPEIVDNTDEPGGKLLHLNNPEPRLDRVGGQDGDGAIWNFTKGSKGRIDIRMKITADTRVADIQLTDRFLDPTDDTSEDVAVFHVRFDARGRLVGDPSVTLSPDVWHDVSIVWDLTARQALLLIDGREERVLDQLYDTPTGGISYLRLRSPSMRALDPAGWFVDTVTVDVSASFPVPEPTAGVGMVGAVGLMLRRATGSEGRDRCQGVAGWVSSSRRTESPSTSVPGMKSGSVGGLRSSVIRSASSAAPTSPP